MKQGCACSCVTYAGESLGLNSCDDRLVLAPLRHCCVTRATKHKNIEIARINERIMPGDQNDRRTVILSSLGCHEGSG